MLGQLENMDLNSVGQTSQRLFDQDNAASQPLGCVVFIRRRDLVGIIAAWGGGAGLGTFFGRYA